MSNASRSAAMKAHRAKLYAEGRDCWSPERDAYLREHYPMGVTVHQLLAVIETLPGKSLCGNVDRIHGRATDLGIKRIITAHAPSARWTPERTTLFRELWATTTLQWQEIRDRLNAIPAPLEVSNSEQMHRRASVLGIKRTAEAVALTRRINGLAQNQNRPPKPPKPPKEKRPPGRPKKQHAEAWRRRETDPEIAAPIIRYDHGFSIGGVHPAAEVRIAVVDDPATADAALERKLARARDMLRRKKDPTEVSGAVRLPLREVFRLQGEMRRGT